MNQYTRSARLQHAKWQQEAFGLPESVYQTWRSQYHSAKHRDIPFRFTLFAWHQWWKRELAKIGPEAKRGLRKGQYMMCRLNDAGAYEDGNVYAGTVQQNQADVIRRDPDARSKKMKAYFATHASWLTGRRGDAHPSSRAVITPLGRFGSMALAGEAHGITRQAVHYKVRDRVPGWRDAPWYPRQRAPIHGNISYPRHHILSTASYPIHGKRASMIEHACPLAGGPPGSAVNRRGPPTPLWLGWPGRGSNCHTRLRHQIF